MLSPYFAFGVPLFLLFLYCLVALIRRKTAIHYLGFVLLLIASFMVVFSLQILQQYWGLEESQATGQLRTISYPAKLLWAPIILGGLLVIPNLWRGIKRVQSFQSH